MSKFNFTRRDFLRTTGLGMTAAGLTAGFPGLSLGAKNYTFGSASAKGSWYPLAVAMSKVINDNIPGYNVTGVTTPGASRENILRIDRDEMELGWSSANTLYQGYNGKEPFKAKRKVAGWFSAYPGHFTIAAREGSGIKTIADLKGKKVALGTPGSQTMTDNVGLIMKNCGLIADKDFKAEYIRFPDAVQKMIDGHIDACSYMMGAGSPGYIQMADSVAVRFLPIPKEAQPKILKQDPAFYMDELPAGAYKGIKEPVAVASLAYCCICSPALSEEFMYKATKAIFENRSFIISASANFKKTQIKKVYQGMPIPVHPGAAKYYKEQGVMP